GNARTETRLQNAQLASAGNTHILSGNNLSLIAADVTANGNITMDAVDQLLIAAGQTLSSAQEWNNESRAFSSGHLYELREHAEGQTVSAAQASTLSAGGTITAHGGTGRVVGSDIHGEQGVNLAADAGDFTVEAAQTTSSHYVHDKEVTVSLGDATAKALANPLLAVQTQDGRATMTLAEARSSESDTQPHGTEMRGAHGSSRGDLSHRPSAGPVNISGANLAADTDGNQSGDVNLSAANKVNVIAATDTASTASKTVTGEGEVSLVVQNQAVEVVKAYERLEDAKEQLEE